MRDNDYRAMVALSVEIVLMRRGGPEYQLVVARLENDYDFKIFDCYDHPDYLRTVLKDVYGDEYQGIVDAIEVEFADMAERKEITDFLTKIRQ